MNLDRHGMKNREPTTLKPCSFPVNYISFLYITVDAVQWEFSTRSADVPKFQHQEHLTLKGICH